MINNNELTCANLPVRPADPIARLEAALKKLFDLKHLCRMHNNAEALDNQYGNMSFSSPSWKHYMKEKIRHLYMMNIHINYHPIKYQDEIYYKYVTFKALLMPSIMWSKMVVLSDSKACQ